MDAANGVIRFKPLEPIQGLAPAGAITHTIAAGTQVPPELKRVAVGQKAVLFRDDPYARAVTMIEGTWYVSTWDRSANCARFGAMANPFFECGFCGSVAELVRACKALVRGEEITVRCRVNAKTTQMQWVTTSLREPHKRKVVAGPASAPATETQPAPPVEAKADALPALLERLKAEKPKDRMETREGVMDRFSRGWDFMQKSFDVLRSNKDLLIFPAASAVCASSLPCGFSASSLLLTVTDLTGVFCTSGSEREFTLEERWYADEEIQARADSNAATAD